MITRCKKCIVIRDYILILFIIVIGFLLVAIQWICRKLSFFKGVK